jgi:hypothetical protein
MENRNQTFPTPYPELNSVLQDLVDNVQTVLGVKFVGAYLQGSFAVGDFDLHSDVDFIMVTEEELPALLVDPIPVETLREQIMATIHDWGQEILSNPDHFNNRFYQGFIVLNYCRMLHDLHRGLPGSKLAGAEWAKANLDPSWKGLIDRAWDGRPGPAVSSCQRADPKDFKATLEFIHYCRNKANT